MTPDFLRAKVLSHHSHQAHQPLKLQNKKKTATFHFKNFLGALKGSVTAMP